MHMFHSVRKALVGLISDGKEETTPEKWTETDTDAETETETPLNRLSLEVNQESFTDPDSGTDSGSTDDDCLLSPSFLRFKRPFRSLPPSSVLSPAAEQEMGATSDSGSESDSVSTTWSDRAIGQSQKSLALCEDLMRMCENMHREREHYRMKAEEEERRAEAAEFFLQQALTQLQTLRIKRKGEDRPLLHEGERELLPASPQSSNSPHQEEREQIQPLSHLFPAAVQGDGDCQDLSPPLHSRSGPASDPPISVSPLLHSFSNRMTQPQAAPPSVSSATDSVGVEGERETLVNICLEEEEEEWEEGVLCSSSEATAFSSFFVALCADNVLPVVRTHLGRRLESDEIFWEDRREESQQLESSSFLSEGGREDTLTAFLQQSEMQKARVEASIPPLIEMLRKTEDTLSTVRESFNESERERRRLEREFEGEKEKREEAGREVAHLKKISQKQQQQIDELYQERRGRERERENLMQRERNLRLSLQSIQSSSGKERETKDILIASLREGLLRSLEGASPTLAAVL
uniref:Uncharacterized protein n=1 Tax=Chromera velia CCMP2878 TaxID=1169474 RepID=A0A0G4FH02_9ALVE|eukprot:Cvel_16782.t1-p1 / transcript=Cvel_16782.t1 / gene=Cvel_16782 / organism=Chromera_velia_CCMP2878 / gene_product=hypothetical protein / transcript_product=hypothetical protein / location=Cvel_scaffold1309:38363-40610(+) / protein_length=521 / sequence_SO=supercontig / SO=protein_coding / is_pseudo=false